MNRARFAVAATLLSAVYAGAALAAQVQAPPMHPVLAGKKITPPLKGEALVEFTQPVTKAIPGKSMVVTTIKVKNSSLAPIARLQIAETWYDKGGAIVAGGRGVINGLLQPGEIQTITIETPYNAKMSSNNWNFTHANGTVKPAKVKTLEPPKDAPLLRAVADRVRSPVEVVEPAPLEVPDVVGRGRVVVAMRYHAGIAAALAGRPAVLLGYSPKVGGLGFDLDARTLPWDLGEPDLIEQRTGNAAECPLPQPAVTISA